MAKTSKAKKVNKPTDPGTVRIKTKDLRVYEKTKTSWKQSSSEQPNAMLVIKLFKVNKNFAVLKDKKNPEFLKGQLSPKGQAQGARINILPNGKKLDKAFSLFAPELTIHDERSRRHWNVIYKNPGGNYSYVYTLEKKKEFANKKYKVVEEFEKCHSKLDHSTYNALGDENDQMALPMYTLLKTYMRVGNEIYYKINRHAGLKTLKKDNITIDGDCVTFRYIGKDGVPMCIKEKFPNLYISRLQKLLDSTDERSFVFLNRDTGRHISDDQFKDAFKRYCGKEFYPHIVRSYYATLKVKEFLKKNASPTKDQVRLLFISIAQKLGHKRFVKKDGEWKESYTVTINHYIRPELIQKIKVLMK